MKTLIKILSFLFTVTLSLGVLTACGGNEDNGGGGDAPTEPPVVYSEGLSYTLLSNDTYELSGIGTCTDVDLVIPATYEGKKVSKIKGQAFISNKSIKSVVIYGGEIGNGAFGHCDALEKVVLKDGVTKIDDYAFVHCDLLESVTIGNGVTSIGEEAFSYNVALKELIIGANVKSIGSAAFGLCSSLQKINFKGSSSEWSEINKGYEWKYNCPAEIVCEKITIKFNLNGGTGTFANVTAIVGENFTLPTTNPTRKDYDFLGWYYNEQKIENGVWSISSSGTVTLTAKWKLKASSEPLYVKNGKYIYFGEFPQTIKANNVSVGTTADSDGYFAGSDGERYAKVVADPIEGGYFFSNNTHVEDGATFYFKVEPIRWRILNESGGYALIFCDSVIAGARFDFNDNNYLGSGVRSWLNNQFYNSAFTTLQKQIIQTTTVDNSHASTGYGYNEFVCANTQDKLFLLSYKEVNDTSYGFYNNESSQDTSKRLIASDYARATGVLIETSASLYGRASWWLRSPDTFGEKYVRYVEATGRCDRYYKVDYADCGVAPALRIKL